MKNKMVVKSNYLIEASYKLSAAEQRVILFLASLIKPADDDFKSYSLSVKEFAQLAGIRHKGEYEDIKEISKRLISRAFTIREPTGDLQLSWLSSAKYMNGKGTVLLRFDPGLKPYLLQLKDRFTRYRLHQVIQLKSFFSIRIYELLKQFEKVQVREFTLEELKRTLGVDDSQYRLYGHFKAKVLNVARQELAEKTDITFDYDEIKVGRCVGRIRFRIQPNHQRSGKEDLLASVPPVIQEMAGESTETGNGDMESALAEVPSMFRDQKTIRNMLRDALEKHGLEYVRRNVLYTNDKSNAAKPGANIGRGSNYRNYLAKALKGDFGLAFKEDQEAHQAKEEKVREEKEAAETATQQAQEKTRREQEDLDRARVYQESLPPEALTHLREEAFSRLASRQQDLVRRKGPGGEMSLKLMMTRVSLERMKLSPVSPVPDPEAKP